MFGKPHILSLFSNEFNKYNNTRVLMNVRFYLSCDMKIALKSHFWRKIVMIFSFCKQRFYGHHKVTQQSVSL